MERHVADHRQPVTAPASGTKRTPRPVPPMSPDLPFVDAWKTAMQTACLLAQRASAAAAREPDPIHLHDYRVALRVQRALLSAFRDLFPLRQATQLRAHLRKLVSETGPLRDLDVLLEAREDLARHVPQALKPGFDRVLDRLRTERDDARATLLARLRARTHALALADVSARIDALHILRRHGAPSAGPVVAVAIAARRKKLERRARKVAKNPTDDAIHALRIAGKKLRYLIEFFQLSLPKLHPQELLRTLKSVQDTLGRAHDLAWQQAALVQLLGKSTPKKRINDAPVVVPRLVAALRHELRASRRKSQSAARTILGARFQRQLGRNPSRTS